MIRIKNVSMKFNMDIEKDFSINKDENSTESNNESIDCRMHLSFSILSKSRKKYLQAREAMMKKNVEF